MSTPLFPAFLKLEGRKVIVVGAGPVGASKIEALVTAGADVTVIAPDVISAVADAPVRIERRRFQPSDLDDAWFAVAAAPPDVNREVGAAAEVRHVFVNAVDDLENATAYLGGVVRKRGVTLAISTDGRAPALAGLLREGLETLLPDDVEAWLAVSERERQGWRERQIPIGERRPLLLAAINLLYDERRSNGALGTDRGGSQDSRKAVGERRPPPREALRRDLDEGRRAKSGVRPDDSQETNA